MNGIAVLLLLLLIWVDRSHVCNACNRPKRTDATRSATDSSTERLPRFAGRHVHRYCQHTRTHTHLHTYIQCHHCLCTHDPLGLTLQYAILCHHFYTPPLASPSSSSRGISASHPLHCSPALKSGSLCSHTIAPMAAMIANG
jgi:hypothetical protein